jgi:transcriptional regulator with XRE-family HTH domain
MVQNISGAIKFAPLFIYSFPLLAPHYLSEAEKFNIRFPEPSEITEIADKLRWYRYRNALLQREVADYIGVNCSTYIRYEEYGHDYYPIEHMEKLAALYDIPVTALLDDFNLFLYSGQGKRICEKRLALNLTQREYANQLGVQACNLNRWEQDKVRVSKSTWERFFKE